CRCLTNRGGDGSRCDLVAPIGCRRSHRTVPHWRRLGVATLRLILASVLLLFLARPTPWRWNRATWRDVLIFGVSLAGLNGFFYAAIDRIPLGVSVAIEFVGPLALAVILSTARR